MGWSCRAEAGDTMARINALHCTTQTYTDNGLSLLGCWLFKEENYFVEWSRREHSDGRITGQVMHVVKYSPDGTSQCEKAGAVTIAPTGELVRAPSQLKAIYSL